MDKRIEISVHVSLGSYVSLFSLTINKLFSFSLSSPILSVIYCILRTRRQATQEQNCEVSQPATQCTNPLTISPFKRQRPGSLCADQEYHWTTTKKMFKGKLDAHVFIQFLIQNVDINETGMN